MEINVMNLDQHKNKFNNNQDVQIVPINDIETVFK